jgi:hypothetical protein
MPENAEKRMQIAILGWGSLLWEGGREFDERHGPWKDGGPTLNIEFSRISKSRQGALTLIIDDTNGSPTTVAWCLSKRQSVEDAVCDLRCREGTTAMNIGCWKQADPPAPPDPIQYAIANWAKQKGLDAVIWTALKSNFYEKCMRAFSAGAAVEYVKTLDPCGKAMAAEYVWRAPEFVQTRVRDALQQEPWFSDAKPSV